MGRMAGLFALGPSFSSASGTLAEQLYRQVLTDFNAERREQVNQLLAEVERDQSLLTQLTVETMDLFNAAAGDRPGTLYGSVITRARPPGLESSLEIGLNPVDQAQQAFYYSLSRLSSGYEFPAPGASMKQALRRAFGEVPDSAANDGIVPTLSQPWGRCIAAVQADHLDIIGHHGGDTGEHYDWLTTHSDFRQEQFEDVWQRVAAFLVASEG